jgi:hypothetical protein
MLLQLARKSFISGMHIGFVTGAVVLAAAAVIAAIALPGGRRAGRREK